MAFKLINIIHIFLTVEKYVIRVMLKVKINGKYNFLFDTSSFTI